MMAYTEPKSVNRVTEKRSIAPTKCKDASTRSEAKKRSAIKPTKKGEIIEARAVVPKIAPVSVPENFKVAVR